MYLGIRYQRTYSYKVDRDHVIDTAVADTLIADDISYFCQDQKFKISVNAKNELVIRFISIPSLNKRPITLNGIPNLIKGLAINSDIFGFFFPRKKPKTKRGIIFIKRE